MHLDDILLNMKEHGFVDFVILQGRTMTNAGSFFFCLKFHYNFLCFPYIHDFMSLIKNVTYGLGNTGYPFIDKFDH